MTTPLHQVITSSDNKVLVVTLCSVIKFKRSVPEEYKQILCICKDCFRPVDHPGDTQDFKPPPFISLNPVILKYRTTTRHRIRGVHPLFQSPKDSFYAFAFVSAEEVVRIIEDHMSRVAGILFTEELRDAMASVRSDEDALRFAETLLAGGEWKEFQHSESVNAVSGKRTLQFDVPSQQPSQRGRTANASPAHAHAYGTPVTSSVAPPPAVTSPESIVEYIEEDMMNYDIESSVQPRVQSDDAILREFKSSGSLSDASKAALLERLPGNDGSHRVSLPSMNAALDEATSELVQNALHVAVASFMQGRGTLATVQTTLDALKMPNGILCHRPDVINTLPKTAKDAVAWLSSQHAPAIHKYDCCTACGRIRRCQLKHSNTCPCGNVWNGHVMSFSVVDFLKQLAAVPEVWQAMEHRPPNHGSRCDVYDLPSWETQILGDPLYNGNGINVKVGYSADGMKPSENKPECDVAVATIFNFPPGMRSTPGFLLPLVISKKATLPTYHHLQDIFSDEMRYLYMVGIDVVHEESQDPVRLHGKLFDIATDSRGQRRYLGMVEPGETFFCIKRLSRGFTMQKETGGAELNTKLLLVDAWTQLPSTEIQLRRACCRLNDRSLLSRNTMEPWKEDEMMPLTRGDDELFMHHNILRSGERQPEAGSALRKHCPLFDTGISIEHGTHYDVMHALSNTVLGVLRSMTGGGLIDPNRSVLQIRRYIAFESRVNNRFTEIMNASDHHHVRDIAPWTMTKQEQDIAHRRGLIAIAGCYLHPYFKGSKVCQAFKTANEKLVGMKCADRHKLAGPIMCYLIGGLMDRIVNVHGVTLNVGEVYRGMFTALNSIRRKEILVSEVDQAFNDVVVALAKLYLLVPTFDMLPCYHQLLEIARELPSHPRAQWGNERFMRVVRRMMTNPATLDVSAMLGLQRFMGLNFFHMKQPSSAGQPLSLDHLAEALADSNTSNLSASNLSTEGEGFSGTQVKGAGKRIKLTPHEVASLWMHYIESDAWPGACDLKELVGMYETHCGIQGASGSSMITRYGAQDKLRLIEEVKTFVMETVVSPTERERYLSLLSIENYVTVYRRCTVDGQEYRAAHLDKSKSTLTTKSYILAKVRCGPQDVLEVGRAQRFVEHVAPGAMIHGESKQLLVQARWLSIPCPSRTTFSKLPMVVMDDSPHLYRGDEDAIDGLLTDFWPLDSIEACPVCIVPLDRYHDVPENVTVPGQPSWTESLLTYRQEHGEVPGTASSIALQNVKDIGKMVTKERKEEWVRLGAVICPYVDMESKFRQDVL